jgi:predicted  nucleic acid-binding Zn-ribbon protein
MTSEERLDGIERQIEENARSIANLTRSVSELGVRIRDLAEESRAADQRLEERIASLVAAMAEHLHQGHP